MALINQDQLADDVVSVFKRTITLTNVQIKALPTTAVELVPAQGAGKVILLQGWVASPVLVAPYTNIHAESYLEFRWTLADNSTGIAPRIDEQTYGDVTGLLADGIIYNFGPQLQIEFLSALMFLNQLGANANNGSITLRASNGGGNFTGGDVGNSLKITVFYMVADL